MNKNADSRFASGAGTSRLPGTCAAAVRRLCRALLCVALLAAGWQANTAVAADAPPRRPNILFIMTDDHATHALSCYGSVINRTPHLDRIAKEGARFDRCFVTNSICTPSRATILTGKYSHMNGTPVFNLFDGNQPTLAKYLQAAWATTPA